MTCPSRTSSTRHVTLWRPKNVGRDLGLGELRTCPGSQGRPRRPENFVDFQCQIAKILRESFKKSRAARAPSAKTKFSTTNVVSPFRPRTD